jgi:diaminopimelate decarboxylase
LNPNIDAGAHHHTTTGLENNKFGISLTELPEIIGLLKTYQNIELIGLHFHIGSGSAGLTGFKHLCVKVNEIQKWFLSHHIQVKHINVGGGLGVDYKLPDEKPVAEFQEYFNIFHQFLEVQSGQQVHFELGRSIVASSGNLITKVLYIKKRPQINFAIVDAGMNDLIRPMLYQAYHKIENISKTRKDQTLQYDVVGPICESTDCFQKAVTLPETDRGDLIAIRTAGAYGEVMSSNYNLREKAKAIYSDELI